MKDRKHSMLRWALALVALTTLAVGVAPTQASTGGASGPMASTEETPEGGLAFGPMRTAGASWYGGPSMWGRKTACGQTLKPSTLGVAHKTLPCGTTVKFVYHGHAVVTQVIDRGPYIQGRAWDLTQAASEALDFEGVGNVRYAVALSLARK
ncbi:MAG TPA: septal ring lytic transglycosylase RlpA family protein [Solirubrobacterales bacterium]|nr:septal ring lytic transglycosylase RlpA family protein [Solirubrobacterales bacterium]